MVLPFLLYLLVLIVDLGLTVHSYNVLQAAARAAARNLAVGAGAEAAQQQANDELGMGRIPPGEVEWTVEDQGDYIAVTLKHERTVLAPGLPLLFGEPPMARKVPLQTHTTFRKRG